MRDADINQRLNPLLTLLNALPQNGAVRVIAIDGRAASGKTTLSAQLALETGAGIVHMDDFFLPPHLRTPDRLATPGGNVHYERFLKEVIPHLGRPEAFCYDAFDCRQMEMGPARTVAASSLRIVEGAYSCHPLLGEYMTVRVFCGISPREQLERIAARDGHRLEDFRTRWIPMEEQYLAAYDIQAKAHIIL